MGYDRGDSFPFDFEPNGIPFVQNQKENCHHDRISKHYACLFDTLQFVIK